MARTQVADSATSQFFINTADNSRGLDAGGANGPDGYAVFGKVIRGLEVVRRIESLETGMRNGFSDVPLEAVKIITIRRVRS